MQNVHAKTDLTFEVIQGPLGCGSIVILQHIMTCFSDLGLNLTAKISKTMTRF